MKKNSNVYTGKDWDDADKKYIKYSVELYTRYKTDLNKEDNYIVGRLSGMYCTLRFKYRVKGVIRGVMDIKNQSQGLIDGVVNEMKE